MISVPKVFIDVLTIRIDQNSELPFDPPSPFKGRPPLLEHFLDADAKPTPDNDVRGTKTKKYVKLWRKHVQQLCKDDKRCRVLSADIQRNPEGTYDANIFADSIPSPTTQNQKVMIFGRPNKTLNRIVPQEGRLLTMKERACVMGFNAQTYEGLAVNLSQRQIGEALGNTVLVNIAETVMFTCWDYIDKVMMKAMPTVTLPLKRPSQLHDEPKSEGRKKARKSRQ